MAIPRGEVLGEESLLLKEIERDLAGGEIDKSVVPLGEPSCGIGTDWDLFLWWGAEEVDEEEEEEDKEIAERPSTATDNSEMLSSTCCCMLVQFDLGGSA